MKNHSFGVGVIIGAMRLLPVLLVALLVGACAKQHVVTQPEAPPLAPPAPPPRVVTPPEPEEPAPTGKPAETPAPKSGRPPARVVEPPREVPKPEEKAPAKPEVAPPPDAQPGKTLQTALTPLPASQEQVKKQVEALLDQAEKDLYKVPVKKLDRDARGQYEQARRFVAQARQALKDQNFVLAQRLADKAATIAGVLGGR